MSAARTERLLNLLTLLLNTRRPISLREIREMDEFCAYQTADPKSGERAFERDKAALVELGIPLRWIAPEADDVMEATDGVGGYIIDREHYFMPEIAMEPGELAVLSMVGSAAAALRHFPDRPALVRALAKLGFKDDPEEKTPVTAHVPLLPGVHEEQVAERLGVVQDAVGRRCTLRLDYRRADGQPSAREVDPFGIYYRHGAWYLVGHCHLRESERTFALSRVTAVELKSRKTKGQEFEIPKGFSLKEKASLRPWEYPGMEVQEARLLLAEKLRPAVGEIFGPRAKIVASHPGAVEVAVQVYQPDGLLQALLPYGADVEVLAPEGLRARMKRMLSDMVRSYRDSLSATPVKKPVAAAKSTIEVRA